jgi:hypothetical protein
MMGFHNIVTKVQVLVKPDLCPPGRIFLINAQEASIDWDLGAPFVDEEGPAKIVLCHEESAASQVREAVRDGKGMELYEDD